MNEERLLRLSARLRVVRWALLVLSLLLPPVIFCCEACVEDGSTFPTALRQGSAVLLYGSFLAFLACDLVIRILSNCQKGRTFAQHLAWCGVYLLLYVGYTGLWLIYLLVNLCIYLHFFGLPPDIQ